MATQFEIDCALMAGRAYQTTRDPLNQFPIPQGWTEFFHVPNNPSFPNFTGSGFEAVAFQSTANPNEIVISFAGTEPLQIADWTHGNVPFGEHQGSETQCFQLPHPIYPVILRSIAA